MEGQEAGQWVGLTVKGLQIGIRSPVLSWGNGEPEKVLEQGRQKMHVSRCSGGTQSRNGWQRRLEHTQGWGLWG